MIYLVIIIAVSIFLITYMWLSYDESLIMELIQREYFKNKRSIKDIELKYGLNYDSIVEFFIDNNLKFRSIPKRLQKSIDKINKAKFESKNKKG